jgi:hypothetical protein
MVDGLAFIRVTGLSIVHHNSFTGCRSYRYAEIDVWPFAELAIAAVCLVARNDMITWLVLRDTLTHALDNT